ncbi:hypothetical protein GEMRC1_004102 [Eukaryota sp. GEM-RC1]
MDIELTKERGELVDLITPVAGLLFKLVSRKDTTEGINLTALEAALSIVHGVFSRCAPEKVEEKTGCPLGYSSVQTETLKRGWKLLCDQLLQICNIAEEEVNSLDSGEVVSEAKLEKEELEKKRFEIVRIGRSVAILSRILLDDRPRFISGPAPSQPLPWVLKPELLCPTPPVPVVKKAKTTGHQPKSVKRRQSEGVVKKKKKFGK